MEKLSPRQKDAVRGLALGESCKETGSRLHLSDKTVWRHLWGACEKLGMSICQKGMLIRLAWRAGLVSCICVVCLGVSIDPRSAIKPPPGTNVFCAVVFAQNGCCWSDPSADVRWTNGSRTNAAFFEWGAVNPAWKVSNYILRCYPESGAWRNDVSMGTNLSGSVSLLAPPKTNRSCWFSNVYYRSPYPNGFWVTNAGPKDFKVENPTGKEFFKGIPGHEATNSRVIWF